MEQFDLVIDSLQTSLSTTSISYLLSILQKQWKSTDKVTHSCRPNQKDSMEELLKTDSRHAIGQLLSANPGSCREIPICRKIISKVILDNRALEIQSSRRSTTVHDKISQNDQPQGCESIFRAIIGKIASNQNRSPRQKLRKGGAKRDLHLDQPISNPLYTVYCPRGRVKTEEEEGLEAIHHIAESFQAWLRTHQTEIADSDPLKSELVSILRHQLEIPSPDELKKIDGVMDDYTRKQTRNSKDIHFDCFYI